MGPLVPRAAGPRVGRGRQIRRRVAPQEDATTDRSCEASETRLECVTSARPSGGPMSLAEQLGRARELAGFTQVDVAAALGVSRVMISYWEGGQRRPNQAQVAALARLYRREPSDLYADAAL